VGIGSAATFSGAVLAGELTRTLGVAGALATGFVLGAGRPDFAEPAG
jgi:hypothetical protein